MTEAELRSLLRETPVPVAENAEGRGLAVASEAFAQRRPPRRPLLPRLAVAVAIAALLGALLLSPAGAAVRGWVDDVFTAGVPAAEPGLTEIPGGGRLLVQSAGGPWVVQPDGARRLLGDYGEATWSPRGLYVAVASGRTLSAVEPDGTPHWSLTADGPVSDPRWSPSGFRIAYRSGRQLRVTAADGTGDHAIEAGTAALAPAWSPLGLSQLAYVDGAGHLRLADSESGASAGAGTALPGIVELEWGGDGATLLEASRTAVRLRPVSVQKLADRIGVGTGRRLALPAGAVVRDAALSPRGGTVALLVGLGRRRGERSAVLLFDVRSGTPRRLLSVPGRLSELDFSPDGGRLLIAWPEADQWLFLPTARGAGRALGEVSAAFAPGVGAAAFPRVEGWCCRRSIAARG
ncbi:MAG TPA: hypothetical protein VGO24_07230 [Solirubrobacterales bacterium]|jgi:hypothetical protein|nr:hypothetical protein [Solirubrobacterales bacterium]